jgi:hypothetical protein
MSLEDRQKAFEKKFTHDADLKFKAEARRNKYLAEWAGAKLGLTGAALDAYAAAVRKADLAEAGDQDVFEKVKTDFAAAAIPVTDQELRTAMKDFMAKAIASLERD